MAKTNKNNSNTVQSVRKAVEFNTEHQVGIFDAFEKSPLREEFTFSQAIRNLMKDYLESVRKSQEQS